MENIYPKAASQLIESRCQKTGCTNVLSPQNPDDLFHCAVLSPREAVEAIKKGGPGCVKVINGQTGTLFHNGFVTSS